MNNDPSTGEPVVIDEIVGSTTIAYSAISSTKARVPFTVTGMSTTALKTGDHIGIRAYMPIVDSSNYYRWYADATQYSSGLGSSSYSGSAWTNKTSMLGVKSDYLAQSILCRASTEKEPYEMTIINTTSTQSTIQIPNK
ncbi:MAG: hypothetical protein LBG52_01610 [Candidatus Peribacteria bacterium]|nr:hypothetical protein [Candidatus Peribacteria bacterium]